MSLEPKKSYLRTYTRHIRTNIDVVSEGSMPIYFSKCLHKSGAMCKTYLIGVVINNQGFTFSGVCDKVASLSGKDMRRTYFRLLINYIKGFSPVNFFLLSDVLGEDWLTTYLRGDAFVKAIGLDLSLPLPVSEVKKLYKRYLDELGEVNALPENE